MQSAEPRPIATLRYVPKHSAFGYHTTPRQRNRIHNQAIKRAKANIGKRREQLTRGAGHGVYPTSDSQEISSQELFSHDLHVQNQTEWDPALLEKYYRLAVEILSPRWTISSGGLRGDPFNAFPISPEGCVPSAIDFCAFIGHANFELGDPRNANLHESSSPTLRACPYQSEKGRFSPRG